MTTHLRLTAAQHACLHSHLLPGDGNEAVALALCGLRSGDGYTFLIRRIEFIPHGRCSVRTPSRVTWPTELLPSLLEEAGRRNLSVLKIHSHPNGYRAFSEWDDRSDRELFDTAGSWLDDERPHASAVMLPDGEMFGRAAHPGGGFQGMDLVSVVGDDLTFWHAGSEVENDAGLARHQQLFGEGTLAKLRRLTVVVVGCSGTGSVVVEQLARLGVGRLILVDPDRIERRNLNRILNSTAADAKDGEYKVHVLARAIRAMGLGTEVVCIPANLVRPETVRAVAAADVAFGCMDGTEGRHLLNRLCAFYLIPYFDIGVRLEADGRGGIDQVAGTVHYVKPDGSSLLSRGVYTMADVSAEALKRTDPKEYGERLKANYIRGVPVDRPAVISVNMQMAAMAVNEFLARLHPYRYDPNEEFAVNRISLIQGASYREGDGQPCKVVAKHAGRGDVRPLLDMPELSERRSE